MTYRIPNNGAFSQTNRGEITGNLYRTQNIDLKTNPGKMRVSPRMVLNTKDDDSGITGMGVPLAFGNHTSASTSQYYAACGIGTGFSNGTGKILVSSSTTPTSLFANDTRSSTPTDVHADFSDMIVWSDGKDVAFDLGPAVFVSTYSSTSKIKKLFNTTDGWNASYFTSFVTNGGLKNMCVGFNRNLYITDDDRIIYIPFTTTSTAGVPVTSGTGTLNFYGAYRPIWARSDSQSLWISLMTYDRGGGTRGYMARWDTTGTAPQKIIDLGVPCALSGTILGDVPYIIDAYGVLKKYGGTGFDEVARLPVANQNIEMPGIYNDLSNSRWIHHRGMDVVDGKININVNNFVSTGVYVEDMPSGIWEYDPEHAEQGLYHKSSPCADTNDYGQQLLLGAGAIYGTKRSTATFLAGYGYYTDSGSTFHNGIFYDDIAHTTARRGMFTTPWLDSQAIKDTFDDAIYRFREFTSGNKIIGKARSEKSVALPIIASVTWTSTTTFTSTDTNFQYASKLDEIEVVQGKGASTTTHVSSIALATGTYTITLKDAIGFTSGSAKVKVNNYRWIGEISALATGSEKLGINMTGGSIQVKTELRDEGGMELNDLTITSKKNQ